MPKYVLSALLKESEEREDLITVTASNEQVAVPIGVSMISVDERRNARPGSYKARKITDEDRKEALGANSSGDEPPTASIGS